MAKLKITEKQARLLENLNKNRRIKITEKQLQKILESEKLGEGIDIPQITKGITQVSPSDGVKFKNAVNKEPIIKNVIHEELWEEFVNELYGINESTEKKYDKLIKLMEVSGYVENKKLSKTAFNNDKDLAKNVILGGLNKLNETGSPYIAMEEMEKTYDELLQSFRDQLSPKPRYKFTQGQKDGAIKAAREKEMERRRTSGEIKEIDGQEDEPIEMDEVDTITMEVPLFLRALEYSREDAETDLTLHDITQKAIELNKQYPVLNMDNYYDIFGGDENTGYENQPTDNTNSMMTEDESFNNIVGLDILNYEPFSSLPNTRSEMGDYRNRVELRLPSLETADADITIFSKDDLTGYESQGPKMVHKYGGYISNFKDKFAEEPVFIELNQKGARIGNDVYLKWKEQNYDAKASFLSGERNSDRSYGLDELETNHTPSISESDLGAEYTHFAIFKDSGKIVDGWDYSSLYDEYSRTYDKSSIAEYTKMDLMDNFPDHKPSEFKVVTKRYLEKNGVDTSDTNNWYKIGMGEVTSMGGGAPGSGVFSGPGGFPVGKLSSTEGKIYEALNDFKKKVDQETEEESEETVDEATTTTTVGSMQYATPGFTSSEFFGNNKKKGKGIVNKGITHKKPTIPGGKFVEFDDCTKLNNNKKAQEGKCSVGAVDNVVKLK